MHLHSDLALPGRTLLSVLIQDLVKELMSRDASTASQQLLPAVTRRLQPAGVRVGRGKRSISMLQSFKLSFTLHATWKILLNVF